MHGCQISDAKGKLIATGTRVGSLYYLDYLTSCQNVSIAENYQEIRRGGVVIDVLGTWEYRICEIWPRTSWLANMTMHVLKEIGFCESCS